MNRTKAIKRLPFSVYFFTIVLLALIGLADSIYLSISHYRVYMDMGYKSFCALSKALNCDTVSQSAYSILLNLPLPIWGIFGYAFLIVCLIGAGNKCAGKTRLWAVIFWIGLGYSAYSVVLALISSYLVGSYCIMCIVSYGVNLAILFYAWIIRKRFSNCDLVEDTQKDFYYLRQKRNWSLAVLALFFMAVVSAWIFLPAYWHFQPGEVSDGIPTGVTAAGHPWIGAESPTLVITEFADYQCFQCKKMHSFLRQLVAANPDKIRLIHRNYPMDHQFNPIVKRPFHVGSGKMALLAIYAASKNKFWQMNDLLFAAAGRKNTIILKDLAVQLNLDDTEMGLAINTRAVRSRLQQDILAGNKLGIAGTPAFVINGKVYLGQIPAGILKLARGN
jgi:protein-disulfide isomerase/uncharacterized membrane protein